MLQSSIVYLSLIFVLTAFGMITAKFAAPNRQDLSFYRWEVIIPMIYFSLIFGMRYGVGVDHLSYLNTYLNGEGKDRFEPGFRWLMSLFQNNGIHFSWFFGTVAFLQIFFFLLAFKSERFLFPFLGFVLIAGGYFLGWMNAIRQDLAACIFIYALKYIESKKWWLYLFWCTIAFLFHKSAVILIPLYPLLKNSRDFFKSISFQIIIIAFSLIIYFLNVPLEKIIFPKIETIISWLGYSTYTPERSETMVIKMNTGIGFLLATFINVIIVLYSNKLKKFYNSNRFIIIYNLYFVGTLAQLLFVESVIFARPFRYFNCFGLVLSSYLLYYLYKKSKTPINIIIFFAFLWIYILLLSATIYRGDTNTARFIFFWQSL